MSQPSARLAALVGSRLCHDLISPIGAIQNGLELLALSGNGMNAPEMALIQESCDSAAARIRFFRVAFGSASEGQLMRAREIGTVLDGVARGQRLRGTWAAEGDHARDQVQLAFLAYLCCETALPQGGDIRITRNTVWSVTATGPRLAVDTDLWSILGTAKLPADITADRVQFALLRTLAEERDMTLSHSGGTEKISISFGHK